MADVRRGKTKRKQLAKDADSEKPTKEEYAVAKYLRFQAPCKEGRFLGNSVKYLIGSKAVDTLLDSKWSAKNSKSNALFTNRVSCANYCERLLEKGFFHRVARPEKRDKKKKPKETPAADRGLTREERKQEKKSKKDEPGEGGRKEKEAEQKEKKDKESKPGDENVDAQKEDSGQEDKKRRKKKLKLEMHDKQVFLDSSDLYVWIYDPVPIKTFIIGLFLVLGAIAVCLFPLWPPEVKLGVYYLSLAGAGFIGVILSLCILRMILFVIVWLLTFGKITFWLLPNLTEDVGFFESFRPSYRCEFKDASKKDEKGATDEAQKEDTASGKDGAENHSDAEEAVDNEEQEDDKAKEDGGSDEEEDEEEERERVDEEEEAEDDMEDLEHEREENGHSAITNDNGYEIVNADDVEVLGQADLEGSEDEDQERQGESQKRSKKGKSPESKKTK